MISARGEPALADSRHHKRWCGWRIMRVPRLAGVRAAVGRFQSATRRCQYDWVVLFARQYDFVAARGRLGARGRAIFWSCCSLLWAPPYVSQGRKGVAGERPSTSGTHDNRASPRRATPHCASEKVQRSRKFESGFIVVWVCQLGRFLGSLGTIHGDVCHNVLLYSYLHCPNVRRSRRNDLTVFIANQKGCIAWQPKFAFERALN
jgi:hypothetical protein